MARKPHSPDITPDAAIDAAMAIAAESGWRNVTLSAVAARAGMPLAQLVEHFPTTTHILTAYARRIDARMLDGAVDMAESPRDRLFEVIMRRFDAMSGHRVALASALRHTAADPLALICGAAHFTRSMALALEAAGIPATGLAGLARVKGIAAVYLYALRSFLDDDSPDLARTMAALDKALARAESVVAMTCQNGKKSGKPIPAPQDPILADEQTST